MGIIRVGQHTANAQSMLSFVDYRYRARVELALLMKKEICDSYEIIHFYIKDRYYFRKTRYDLLSFKHQFHS